MENLHRIDDLTAGTSGSLQSTMKTTMKTTMKSTGQAWNQNEKNQQMWEKKERSRVQYAADAKRVPERWHDCEDALHSWKRCRHRVGIGHEAIGRVGKYDAGPNKGTHWILIMEMCIHKIPKGTLTGQPMNSIMSARSRRVRPGARLHS